MSNLVVLKPRMSEKAYGLSESNNTYIFDVPAGCNSNTIADAIISQFKVGVKNVRIANIAGKSKRNTRSSSRNNSSGKRSDIHKAYVTLKEGDKLPIFAAVEAQEKAEADTQKKVEKIAEKAAKKEKK